MQSFLLRNKASTCLDGKSFPRAKPTAKMILFDFKNMEDQYDPPILFAFYPQLCKAIAERTFNPSNN